MLVFMLASRAICTYCENVRTWTTSFASKGCVLGGAMISLAHWPCLGRYAKRVKMVTCSRVSARLRGSLESFMPTKQNL
jgi:hypothetical protein